MGFNAIGFVYVLYVIFNPYYIDGTPSGARVLAGILIGLWAALGTVLFRGAGWYREGEPLVPERARRRSELWWGVFGLVWGFYLAWRGLDSGLAGGGILFFLLMLAVYALVVWLGMRYELPTKPAES